MNDIAPETTDTAQTPIAYMVPPETIMWSAGFRSDGSGDRMTARRPRFTSPARWRAGSLGHGDQHRWRFAGSGGLDLRRKRCLDQHADRDRQWHGPVNAELQRLVDEAALRRTAELYAQGADRRDKALWRAVLADDCVIEVPGFRADGLDANLASIDALEQMFRGTVHRLHQQVVSVDGDSARGVTLCTADHLLRDSDEILAWSIRYHDAWRRVGDRWRFVHRHLLVEWEEVRPVNIKGEQA